MKKILKLLCFIVSISILLLLIMSTNVRAEDATFSLNDTIKTIKLKSNGYLYYTGKPVGETITWTSSDTNVATVDNGTVTGVGIGTATITATVGEQSDSCEVTVTYGYLSIRTTEGENASSINLVMEEHFSQTLKAVVEDGMSNEISGAEVIWKSSNTNVVKVDNTGKITATGVGTATVTAESAGVSDTCEIKVVAAPEFTDFSKAKYELLFDTDTDLKISGIVPKDDLKNNYYYVITSNNTKPTIPIDKNGSVDSLSNSVEYLIANTDENYIYDRNIDKYVELNQELYLWVIQDVRLEATYNDGQNDISYSTKFVVEGQKLTRPELPQLNLILKTFNVGAWGDGENQTTWINFRFPSATENRKFTVKIGEVTDSNILKKIQNNDYSGITELQTYAKNNKAIYSASLTTTLENYYKNEQSLFDGRKLLKDDSYYYIYVVFDDENGKYLPIEGVTLGQAWLSEVSDYWNLWAYTSEDFKWNNLSSTYEEPDKTIADKIIPHAGKTTILMMITVALGIAVVISIKKYNKFRDI